jgi:O-antigen ligase
MWQEHPIAGVGIGQFSGQVSSYLPPVLSDLSLGAHNMYMQVLAETGIVGLFLFMVVLVQAGLLLYKASRQDGASFNIAYAWFIAFMVLLLGGLLKHDHYDKMLWLFIGISVTFVMAQRREPVHEQAEWPVEVAAVSG